MVLFGGFNSTPGCKNLINNDLFVLSLDGSVGNMLTKSDLVIDSFEKSNRSNINNLGEITINDKSTFGKQVL